MVEDYLIDTNAVIDYLENKLPHETSVLIDKNQSQISVITRMELLGWLNASTLQIKVLEDFVNTSMIFNLDEPVILKTIEIRKSVKIKLPDAIICATALVNNFILITNNKADFKNINGLRIV